MCVIWAIKQCVCSGFRSTLGHSGPLLNDKSVVYRVSYRLFETFGKLVKIVDVT